MENIKEQGILAKHFIMSRLDADDTIKDLKYLKTFCDQKTENIIDGILRKFEEQPPKEQFVLRLDDNCSDPIHLEACRSAALAYAALIRDHMPKLSQELKAKYHDKISRPLVAVINTKGMDHKKIEAFKQAWRNAIEARPSEVSVDRT